jgi:hypothetical protein
MWRKNIARITGVKSIAPFGKIVALSYASSDNSSPLGGKVALYSLDAQITIFDVKNVNTKLKPAERCEMCIMLINIKTCS